MLQSQNYKTFTIMVFENNDLSFYLTKLSLYKLVVENNKIIF